MTFLQEHAGLHKKCCKRCCITAPFVTQKGRWSTYFGHTSPSPLGNCHLWETVTLPCTRQHVTLQSCHPPLFPKIVAAKVGKIVKNVKMGFFLMEMEMKRVCKCQLNIFWIKFWTLTPLKYIHEIVHRWKSVTLACTRQHVTLKVVTLACTRQHVR